MLVAGCACGRAFLALFVAFFALCVCGCVFVVVRLWLGVCGFACGCVFVVVLVAMCLCLCVCDCVFVVGNVALFVTACM